jgi:hypothetical protein
MHIRDKRTVGEQVKSGLQIAGLVLLTLVLLGAMLKSASFVAGTDSNPQLSHEILGSAILIAISVLMFFTVRYWAKWFTAFLAWAVIRFAFRAPLSSHIVGAWWIPELLLVLAALFILSIEPVWRRDPFKLETIALIFVVLSLSFATVLSSFIPLFSALITLGGTRLITWRKSNHHAHRSNPYVIEREAK